MSSPAMPLFLCQANCCRSVLASFGSGEYRVSDPSFDGRPVADLVEDYTWMRERVLQIREALHGDGRPLTAAAGYLDLLESIDPTGH